MRLRYYCEHYNYGSSSIRRIISRRTSISIRNGRRRRSVRRIISNRTRRIIHVRIVCSRSIRSTRCASGGGRIRRVVNRINRTRHNRGINRTRIRSRRIRSIGRNIRICI